MLYKELRGKNVIVTGGRRGIGRSIVKELASIGMNVSFTYVTAPVDMEQYKEGLRHDCGRIEQYYMDICDANSVKDAVMEIEKEMGDIHFLINNAGITRDKLLMVMKRDEWDDVINTNLTGVFRVCKEVLPSMLGLKTGAIVNVSSVAGSVGIAGQTNYCASKAGVIGLTKALAMEVAGKNIRVNSIAPGYVDTEMMESMTDEKKKIVKQNIPLGRIADGKEIASVVMFLLSDTASYITGSTIHVDGGITC